MNGFVSVDITLVVDVVVRVAHQVGMLLQLLVSVETAQGRGPKAIGRMVLLVVFGRRGWQLLVHRQ